MKRISLSLLIAWFLLLAGGPEISAQEQDVSWDRLSKAERQVLKPYADQWKDFPADKQKRLQKGARRWGNLTPKERGIVKNRFQSWKKFTPKQKAKIRSKFQHFKRLPRNKQDRIRLARHWFRNLPQERKEKLRQRWKKYPTGKTIRLAQKNSGIKSTKTAGNAWTDSIAIMIGSGPERGNTGPIPRHAGTVDTVRRVSFYCPHVPWLPAVRVVFR